MGGAASRLHGLARWLAQFGYDVTVVAGFPNYPSGETPDQYHWKLWRREQQDGIKIIRTWVYTSPKGGAIRRLANYFSFVVTSMIAGWLASGKKDVVIASCPPLFIGISGWLVALFGRAKFVFDIRDLWPDVAVEAGEFSEDSLAIRMAHRLANFLYHRSDHVTPVTENKRQKILAKGISASRISVVANGVDLDLIPTDMNREAMRDELGLNDKFVVVYAGLIGIAQNVEVLVDAAAELSRDSNVHVLIVGDGVRRLSLEQKTKDLKLDNVTLLGRQPKERISHLLNAADLAFVSLSSSSLQDAVPSKLLEAWAHRLPVLLVAGGEAAEIANREQAAHVIAPEESDRISDAIVELKDNPTSREALAQNGFAFVESHLTREKLAREMEAVLQKVVGASDTSTVRGHEFAESHGTDA